jgi:predicted RNA-binding protein with PIN domain
MYLIDGYNLLHALGVLHGRVGPGGLEKARLRLLGLLRATCGDEASEVTVVFDAAKAPRGAPSEQNFEGIRVVFAVGKDEADDLIEELIRRSATPQRLTIVSDDHRLQQAGRRRDCAVLGCMEFLDHLERRRPTRPPQSPEKSEQLTAQETQHWLAEFADLADDPDLTELFDPFGFLED